MLNQEWPADDYAIGSYIQAGIADHFLSRLHIKNTDHVLDIGCGNGSYTKKILERIPDGSLTGIDASKNMIELAKKTLADYPNIKLKHNDVSDIAFTNEFDSVVSFWCLQWTSHDIKNAFQKIYNALKNNGRVMTLFPTGDDPLMLTFQIVKDSGQFAELNEFDLPLDYSHFKNLEKKLESLPFKHLQVERIKQSIELPDLTIFQKFVNAIPFFNDRISAITIREIKEAMVKAYEELCKEKYNGNYLFDLTVFWVSGQK